MFAQCAPLDQDDNSRSRTPSSGGESRELRLAVLEFRNGKPLIWCQSSREITAVVSFQNLFMCFFFHVWTDGLTGPDLLQLLSLLWLAFEIERSVLGRGACVAVASGL